MGNWKGNIWAEGAMGREGGSNHEVWSNGECWRRDRERGGSGEGWGIRLTFQSIMYLT